MMARNILNILLLPALVLITGAAVLATRPALPLSLHVVLPIAPFVLALVAAGLGLWFGKPRAVLMAVLIAATHWVLQAFPVAVNVPVPEDARPPELGVIFAVLSIALPLFILSVAEMQKRSLMSAAVLSRGLLALALLGLVTAVWGAGEGALRTADHVLHLRLFERSLDAWTLLPQPALILFACTLVWLLVRVVRTRQPVDGGLLGSAVALALGLHVAWDGDLSALLISFGALILAASVVHETYRMAFLDELTGLPARRALMMELDAQGPKYTVAMLDVDHFKKFNDTYGHDVGDQVLKLVASKMMKVKGGGRAFRYGGEEFTVVFPRRDSNDSLPHLEVLREAIAEAHFKLRSQDRPKDPPEGLSAKAQARKKAAAQDTVSVTISIGVAERTDGQAPDEALKAADDALYRAKDQGRNRVAV